MKKSQSSQDSQYTNRRKTEETMTISRLARKYGLSRSTLLYYDSLGLLMAPGHRQGEYRVYGASEEERLRKICMYRAAGIPLKAIKKILDVPETDLTGILSNRFEELNREIQKIQEQQKIIAGLLQNPQMVEQPAKMTKGIWTSILTASGYTEEQMRNWHITFERQAPKQHTIFLRYLHISEEEIATIKSWAG